jgi:hypothetical protein
MTAPAVATCWSCGTTRDLAALLVITDRHVTRAPWYCCRPTVDGPRGDCLRLAAGPAADYTITSPEPPLLPRPRSVPDGLSAADELAAVNDGRAVRVIADALYDHGLR